MGGVQRQGSIGGSAAYRIRATGILFLAAHLVFVAWVSLRPLDVPWVMPANLHPFDGIRADLRLGWPEAASRIGAGLALFAPLGVLLPLVHGRLRVSPLASLVRTVTAGALLSLAVELLQTGVPGQVADVDSLLLNTAGVALAHVAVVPAVRGWLRRREEPGGRAGVRQGEPAQGRTPRIPRVGIAP
ncbi:glycopeptide antibiotics resistance protein [Streptomyces achromogenes]|uniref:Glycopeptide antibiotics resistance protein n=1 Tax=Streptomyces achromogenes TaxID=67255 RepID=A0ABU0Q5D1_STRAH|nr:glycopeptide antibiotics resistance protein [Streptomyces achromogenes]MDQ0833027.1 glycopeptide antibiotics resistance protein [Streptomyces achromogenes]